MNLFPKQISPYYIVSPPWTHTSSGVRTMHLLCHALNEVGQKAYLVPSGGFTLSNYVRNHSLNTPLVDCADPDMIAVYPEIIEGNPLNAKRVVRYVLGQKENTTFSESDIVFACTTSLGRKVGSLNVLTIPTFDRNIYYNRNNKKSGSCFYAQKYDRVLGHKLLPITDGMMRVEGSVERVLDIIINYKTCYSYEDSEIIVNAALCGCDIVLVKSEYFNKISTENEFYKFNGMVWSDGERFNDSCGSVLSKAVDLEIEFPRRLDNFIKITQGGF